MLEAYLDRIGVSGPLGTDLETLRRIHRGHVLSIPYENLDVQLGRKVSRHPAAAYDKIVRRRRGGWCYEMNGLLSWALDELGFNVRRLAGGVIREALGDEMIGNHLVILVDLEGETWLCDAGFGDGLIEPVRLTPGEFAIGPYRCNLSRIDGGWWRYRNDPRGGAPSFDFHESVIDETLLESLCVRLQTDPQSPFVQNAVLQRWRQDALQSLVGRVFSTVDARGKSSRLIASAEEFMTTLKSVFDLDLPEAATLWPKILARPVQAELLSSPN
jgi:N-hydroxyarylamine O-acetyltransferase